jgi:ATP-dependent exoDNAse (exonuclease V) alpha subunit
MNFSQFLTENPASQQVTQIKPQKKDPPPNITKVVTKKITPPKVLQTNQEPQREFKKGNRIIITRMEGSSLNVYKGYFGEIKEVVKNGETIIAVLEAMNYPKPIRFPIGHFKHLEEHVNHR